MRKNRESNIRSAALILREKDIPIKTSAPGGTERKSVFLDVENGCISYIEGDEKEKMLWESINKNSNDNVSVMRFVSPA